jgi:hypothetical protein
MKTLNKYSQQIVGIVLAIVILVGGVLFLTSLAGQSKPQTNQVAASQQQADAVSFIAKKDKTVLQQLKVAADNVKTKASSYGEYVESIGTLKGGTDGKYWTFYVDGKMASVGADVYTTKGGEKIEWKFEKAQ